ncbi:hypothetical protein AB0M92_38860 [Streptomyces sp. NPDC051582]|uniref:hypothetical protein n=1 Tax=Streptomyces sp. NPDC051582 TaxID=3155167 RepID=UPI0034378FB6
MNMHTTAAIVRWVSLGAGALVLVAFAVFAVRRYRAGTRCGELLELMERDWFTAGKTFLAVLAGLAGSWTAALVGGARPDVWDAIPLLFPMALTAAFTASRLTASGLTRTVLRALVLIAVPFALGTVMTGW